MLHGERRKRHRERNREAENGEKLQFAIKNEKISPTSCQISSSNCLLISLPKIRRSKEDEASRTKRSHNPPITTCFWWVPILFLSKIFPNLEGRFDLLSIFKVTFWFLIKTQKLTRVPSDFLLTMPPTGSYSFSDFFFSTNLKLN